MGADPDATPPEASASLWLGSGETFFFLRVASGSLPFLWSGSSIVAAWNALKWTHRVPFFTGYGDDSTASWHLEEIVSMVSHCHELGQGWVPEDGVVWQTDVGDVEVDELGAVVVVLSEGDWKANLPYGNSGTISDS